jgi:type IV pilus assembly protein PilC
MIKAGELGGVLDSILDRLCGHLERENEINSKVKSASVYPTIIAIFAVIVVFFIISFIMPTFVGMFQSSGVALPVPTQIMLGVGLFIRSKFIWIAITIFILVYLLRRFAKTDVGALFFDALILHLPLIGKTASRIIVARFARTMGTLVRSGISVLQALEVVEDVVGNAVVKRAIKKATTSITEGQSISGPLLETGVFEPMVTQMIAVGEETGSLDEMLVRMSDYYEREVMYSVDTMMALIEPLMIIVVAIIVGGVVIATIMPIFDMVNMVN